MDNGQLTMDSWQWIRDWEKKE